MSSPVTRRSAVALIGLAGLTLPALLRAETPPSRSAQQTHMEEALDALKNAKRHLDMAVADKGGHRAKALQFVASAITETEAGIAYAKAH